MVVEMTFTSDIVLAAIPNTSAIGLYGSKTPGEQVRVIRLGGGPSGEPKIEPLNYSPTEFRPYKSAIQANHLEQRTPRNSAPMVTRPDQ